MEIITRCCADKSLITNKIEEISCEVGSMSQNVQDFCWVEGPRRGGNFLIVLLKQQSFYSYWNRHMIELSVISCSTFEIPRNFSEILQPQFISLYKVSFVRITVDVMFLAKIKTLECRFLRNRTWQVKNPFTERAYHPEADFRASGNPLRDSAISPIRNISHARN